MSGFDAHQICTSYAASYLKPVIESYTDWLWEEGDHDRITPNPWVEVYALYDEALIPYRGIVGLRILLCRLGVDELAVEVDQRWIRGGTRVACGPGLTLRSA